MVDSTGKTKPLAEANKPKTPRAATGAKNAKGGKAVAGKPKGA